MATGLQLITRDAVDAALREFADIGREAFLARYGFGAARDYVVQDPVTGVWADSKAIVGAAYGHRFPERGPLRSRDFSGGIATVVRLLRELEFEVRALHEVESVEGNGAWSTLEVELVVADYLDMLMLELASQRFNKAERARGLMPLLRGRTKASIEFKRRNISAGLLELGYPTLRGYLPAANRQHLLVDVIERQLAERPGIEALTRSFIYTPAVSAESTSFDVAKVEAPARHARKVRAEDTAVARPFRASKRDYLERETRNRSLGQAGELFVLRYEQWRLAGSGLAQLADRVRHVSVEDGDGLGYDILSFNADGTERYLEVKTTSFSELTPFFVTATELRLSREASEKFTLCRLFDFRATPRFFELDGRIETHCHLDANTYRASIL